MTLFRQAFDIYSRIGHAAGIGAAAAHLASAHYYLGDMRESLRNSRLSFRICKERRDRLGMSLASTYMGNVFAIEGQLMRALVMHRRSIRLAHEIGDRRAEIRARVNAGQLLASMRRYADAFGEISAALNAFKKNEIGGRFYLLAQNVLSSIYRALNQHDLADEVLEDALRHARMDDDALLLASLLTNYGIGAAIRKDWLRAIEILEESLDLKLDMNSLAAEATTRRVLGMCLQAMRRNEEALLQLERARTSARMTGGIEEEWRVCCAMAELHTRLRRYDAAQAMLQEAMGIVDRYALAYDRAFVQRALARGHIIRGESVKAVRLLQEAMNAEGGVLDDLVSYDAFQLSLFEDHVQTHELLQWALVDAGGIEAALEIAERSRAGLLADALARRFDFTAHASGSDLDVRSMRAIAKATRTTLLVYSAVHDPRVTFPEDPAIEIFVWVIPSKANEALRFRRIRSGSEIRATALALLTAMSARGSTEDVEAALRRLHDQLIAPIADTVSVNDELTIVANDFLPLVPFAALTDSKGVRLVERHAIATVPSVRVLHLLDQHRRAGAEDGDGALVVGNPLAAVVKRPFWRAARKFEAIPWAEREAVLVASRFRCQPVLAHFATHDVVAREMAGKRFLHFATHGLFDPSDGVSAFGALLLATSPDGKELLNAEEVANMQLTARLATLSACESGQGHRAADGFIGLPRAFLTAGVRCVIAALWRVPDVATDVLMEHFYDALLSEPYPTVATAMRAAMVRVMETHPDPRDWAGFVIIGDPHACGEKSGGARPSSET